MRKSKERSYTNARERAEKNTGGFTSASIKTPEGAQFLKVKTGTMLLDILPYAAGKGNPFADEGNLHWERTYNVHRGIGANGDTFLCPRMTSKKPCPICEHRMALMKKGDEDDEQLIKDLSPKQRQLFNVINLKDPDKGVQLFDISFFLFGKALDARLRAADEDEEWEKFFFLEGGMTLRIGWAEESFAGHTFHKVESIDFKVRKEDYDDAILEEVHCLDELLIEESYAKLKKVFLEARDTGKDDDDEDEDEDEDETPKAKKKSTPVDDDEDEDDEPAPKRKTKPAVVEDDDEDDEEEEAPKSKKKTPPKEEDWDDFDEDDDEDEKPKAKKKVVEEDEDDDEDDEPTPKAKSKKPVVDEDEEDADEDEDEPPKKKKVVDEDDDEDEDEDEEPAPKKGKTFGDKKLGKGFAKAKEQDEDEDDE